VPPTTYDTAAVSRTLGMSPRRVRALARAGICAPQRVGRRLRFRFQDLVLLRAWVGLVDAGVSMPKLRRAVDTLSRQLRSSRPLSGVRVYAKGRDVVARIGPTLWHLDSGQLLFSFAIDDLRRSLPHRVGSIEAKPTPGTLSPRVRRANAAACFERALRLEARGDNAGAEAAYGKAIELDPDLVDAYINLGRLAHERFDIETASRWYEQALALDPDDSVAHYNLALTLEDKKRPAVAIAHYLRAVEVDPDFADAHFNLARLFEGSGRRAEALRHLLIYRQLVSS